MKRAGMVVVWCFYEHALDVVEAIEDGSYWTEYHGPDENARFWDSLHYRNSGGGVDDGGGDAAGTGGSGE